MRTSGCFEHQPVFAFQSLTNLSSNRSGDYTQGEPLDLLLALDPLPTADRKNFLRTADCWQRRTAAPRRKTTQKEAADAGRGPMRRGIRSTETRTGACRCRRLRRLYRSVRPRLFTKSGAEWRFGNAANAVA